MTLHELNRYDEIQRLEKGQTTVRYKSTFLVLVELALIVILGTIAVAAVLSLKDVIDPPLTVISTAPSHTAIVLHERARGERP